MSDAPSTVIITGAGGALGAAVIEAFHEANWNLALWEYSADVAKNLRSSYPDALVSTVDLTDADAAHKASTAVADHFGGADALVALAGGFGMQPAHEGTASDLERMLNLNVRTLVHSVQAVLPGMLEQSSGFVLGVSAAAATQGGPQMALYAASKAAVAVYLASVAEEVRSEGIGVTTLYPMGALDTPANREAMPDTDPASFISREALAETILEAARRPLRGHTGEIKVWPVTTGG